MIQKINLPVSVVSIFDHKKQLSYPLKILFEGKTHPLVKLGYHHTSREGRVLYHIFSVVSPSLFFRLKLNTESLSWSLEEISDGEAN